MRIGVRWAGLFVLAAAMPVLGDDRPSSPPANKDAKKYVATRPPLAGKLNKVNAATSEISLEYRAGLGKYAKTQRDTLTLADDVKVWFVTPPEKVDENGDRKKLTREDLDKLKSKSGPTKGLYAADVADLHDGQQVQVTLGRPKDTIKKPAPKGKGAAAEKEFEYVFLVVVQIDAKLAPAKPEPKK
jgi:hypothetical protein